VINLETVFLNGRRMGKEVIELRKKGVLKIAVGSLFICSFILAIMYPVIFASKKDKIHFLMSPNPFASFAPPAGKEADEMIVWVSVIKDSTYGSFNLAFVGYQTYYTDHHRYEWHFYTDNLRAGEMYAYLQQKVYPSDSGIPIEWAHDVKMAKIDITTSEHQLNVTVIVKGKTFFTAEFAADMDAPLESRIEPGSPLSQELYLSVEARRLILPATVTGLEAGDFTGGRFDYIDTELYDSSLLP